MVGYHLLHLYPWLPLTLHLYPYIKYCKRRIAGQGLGTRLYHLLHCLVSVHTGGHEREEERGQKEDAVNDTRYVTCHSSSFCCYGNKTFGSYWSPPINLRTEMVLIIYPGFVHNMLGIQTVDVYLDHHAPECLGICGLGEPICWTKGSASTGFDGLHRSAPAEV